MPLKTCVKYLCKTILINKLNEIQLTKCSIKLEPPIANNNCENNKKCRKHEKHAILTKKYIIHLYLIRSRQLFITYQFSLWHLIRSSNTTETGTNMLHKTAVN